ncbi:MAG: FAD-linked oxidase C-terminal domain-containing protein [Cypionkella sp.]
MTLRLVPEARAHAYASFAFAGRSEVLAALAEIERAGIASECFGFDPHLNAIRMRRDSLASDARALVGMMRAQGSMIRALKEGARVALAGRAFLDDAGFSLHVLAEGRIDAAAEADIAEARRIAQRHGGSEVENTIPKVIRANPFGPLNSVLGPDGERWAPVHGLLPHSRADACYAAIEALFGAHRGEMERHGLHTGTLIAAVGGKGVIIEPCLYWPGARNPLVEATPEPAHLARLPRHPANATAGALAQRLKHALVDLFHAHGAVHLQIARTYRYRDSLDPAADALLLAVKRQLDPHGRMNPGALGLG